MTIFPCRRCGTVPEVKPGKPDRHGRISVDSSVATMSEPGQNKYADALEHLQCTVIKREKGDAT